MGIDLSKFDWLAIGELVLDLLDGADDDDLDDLASFGDKLVDLGDAPLAEVIEQVDQQLFKIIIDEIAQVLQKVNDPEKIRQRAERAEAKGKPRVAARRRARADRVEARRAERGA